MRKICKVFYVSIRIWGNKRWNRAGRRDVPRVSSYFSRTRLTYCKIRTLLLSETFMLFIMIMLIDMLAHISIIHRASLTISRRDTFAYIIYVLISWLLRSFVIATNDEVQLVLARFSKSGEEKKNSPNIYSIEINPDKRNVWREGRRYPYDIVFLDIHLENCVGIQIAIRVIFRNDISFTVCIISRLLIASSDASLITLIVGSHTHHQHAILLPLS